MKILPFRTIPLRASLRATVKRDAVARGKIETLAGRMEPWSNVTNGNIPNASISASIHPYPGLGHQLAGWISGYLWSKDLDIDYRGGLITRDSNNLFDFGTPDAPGQLKTAKIVQLSSVNDERDQRSLIVLRGQINRALARSKGSPIHFKLALDQPRWDQTPAAEVVRRAVLAGAHGDDLLGLEDRRPGYIAIHVRRGDVSEHAMGGATGHSRWLDESWYIDLLRRLKKESRLEGLEVRAYALGEQDDFPMLRREGVTLCLNGNRDSDFVEMSGAKVLIAAPSSFSFTAGLASRGVVIAQSPWWHHVPNDERWITADQSGAFSTSALERAVSFAR